MKLGELWRRWQTRDYPEHMLTKAEAIERVRQYAEANGLEVCEPLRVHVERRELEPGNRAAGFRHIYVVAMGVSRAMPRAEVDAIHGKVLAWRSHPR